ncbi:MAG: DUF1444 family protein [Fuerstiella sp.]
MSQNSEEAAESDDGGMMFRGPANWFTLRIPAGLRLKQTEAFIEIAPQPDRSEPESSDSDGISAVPWSLTLYAAWVEEGEPETDASSFSPTTLFPGVARCRKSASLDIGTTGRAWEGMSVKPAPSWWRRWFRRRQTYEWRLWVVEQHQIIVVASLQSSLGKPLDPETVRTCTELLSSISFAEELARPPELFRREVMALARQYFPLLDIGPAGTFGIRINDSEIHLTNFYRSYLQAPDQLKQIVLPGLTTVVRLQEWGPDQLMPPLDTVAERIMPMLYPDAAADSSLQDFVRVPWVAGLSIMFVLDEDDTYRFVHKALLQTWQTTREELQRLAMENLDRYARDNPLEVTLIGEDGDPRMLVPLKPNAYNSVRLLGDHLNFRLRQMLGAELVVGVPNRDFFVAVSLNHPHLIGQIQQQVVQDFQSMHHPLTSRLLVISADGVSEYCEQ